MNLRPDRCEGWLEGYLPSGRHGFFSCCKLFSQTKPRLVYAETCRSKTPQPVIPAAFLSGNPAFKGSKPCIPAEAFALTVDYMHG
jgi:hypothetical protein